MQYRGPALSPPRSLLERLPEEWEALLASWGEPRYRAGQVFRWIHGRQVTDPAAMTDLSKSLRARLATELTSELDEDREPTVVHVHRSADSTRKLLVRMADGRDVETVLIPQLTDVDPDAEDDATEVLPGRKAGRRVTQCISSQVGCAMGCVFCASGVAGLKRSLRAAEIVGQVRLGKAALDPEEALRNVVFMGMGEPLHNYEAVARALVLMTHPDGLGLSTRRVTVSTSGLVPEIDRLGRDFDGQVQLAVSLHQVDDAKRSEIMPINRRYPLADLVRALERYPLPRRRRITIEYTLIRAVNDSLAEADALARLLARVPIKVNLIPMNPITESPLAAPDFGAVEAFQRRLREHDVACFIRTQRGDSIAAACGQLALHGEKAKVKRPLPTVRSDS
jgi:23S rRNA (adenine2503-C2)-methyltransferase